ncbi:MAG: hypothetical protein IJJ99_07260 [Oscillospiraceae bacterium]|nr:hypothetical protein [Oscillospiraceae bacterium]
MTGFCTNCGRPLPENGICPCTKRRAQGALHKKTRGGLDRAARALPSLWIGYLKDPVGASRLAQERREATNGLTMMAATVLLSFFSTMLFTLRYATDHFIRAILRWALTGLFAPVIALVLTLGLVFTLTAIAKMRVNLRAATAAVGASLALPMTLLAASIVLSLIHITVFYVFCAMLFATWALSVFLLISQVFGIRFSLINCLIAIGFMTAGYYAVALLRNWMIAGLS